METSESKVEAENKEEKQEYDLNDKDVVQITEETAWDLYHTTNRPHHDHYEIYENQKDSIPIFTNICKQFRLRGFNASDIIEIIGNEQSGKTQILYELLLNCTFPEQYQITQSTINKQPTILSLDGHDSKAIFYDLNLHFNFNRLKDIFTTIIKKKVISHNKEVHNLSLYQTDPPKRHSLPTNLHKQAKLLKDKYFFINFDEFLNSDEYINLWLTVKSKIYLCRPLNFQAM